MQQQQGTEKISRVEEFELCTFFGGDSNDATKHGIWKLFSESPYFDRSPGFSYQLYPQQEDPSGQAPSFVIYKFKAKEQSQELHRVYYVVGQATPKVVDFCGPGMLFPLPDLYHALLTKYILATNSISTLSDHLRMTLNIQREADTKIEEYSALEPQKQGVKALFRNEEDNFTVSQILQTTFNRFDIDQDFV